MLKSKHAAVAALSLLLPVTALAQSGEKPFKIGDFSRCAAVYQLSSDVDVEGSEAQQLAAHRFLQYYLIMVAMAEGNRDDGLTKDTLKTLLDADIALAKADAAMAKAAGFKGALFTDDFAVCDSFRASHASLFAAADKQIETLTSAQAQTGTP